MKTQVNADHYEFKKYISKGRWNSFYHQIDEILSFLPNSPTPISVLEIGVGSGVLKAIIKNVINCKYESMDIDEKLNPDHVGSVLKMPFQDKQYDIIGCFQVLEHLPYDYFDKALSELLRVAKKAVIISLPDSSRIVRIHLHKLFEYKLFRIPSKKYRKYKFDGEHYWEINKKGFELKKIIKHINEISNKYNFSLKKEYRVWENPNHHFFILEHK